MSLDTTLNMLDMLPEGVLLVTESGIHNRHDVALCVATVCTPS